jgi:16S rRNA (cytosine1402-N4)-methyltransferase
VNREFEELGELLRIVPGILKPGGRFVVLTFMSTEDRKVKHAFQGEAKAGRGVILTRHVVKPSHREVLENPASRSSKLRALQRV